LIAFDSIFILFNEKSLRVQLLHVSYSLKLRVKHYLKCNCDKIKLEHQ